MNDRIGISDAEPLHYKGVEEPRLPVIEQLLSDRPGRLIERVDFDEEAYVDWFSNWMFPNTRTTVEK